MKIYKVVPAPSRVVVKPKEVLTNTFTDINNIITMESLGGWELVSSMPVTVVEKKNAKNTFEEVYNLLVFAKDKVEEE